MIIQPKTKIFVPLGILIVGLAGYGFFKATPPPSGQNNQPKIKIAPQNYNFGEVEFGKTIEYTFTIKNTGGTPLEIKRVATSCGCTTAKADKQIIDAGDTAQLLVVYDTAAMGEGPHGKGQQDRIIYVKTNDPNNPQVNVTIQAYVR